MTCMRCFVVHLTLVFLVGAVFAPPATAGEKTERVLERIGVRRGICVVSGDPSCEFAIRLARESNLLVYLQLPSSEHVDRSRRKAEAAGLDATELQIDQGDLSRLHLADNVADALIVAGDTDRPPEAEVLRVLRPGGRALLGKRRLVKRRPDGMDDWSHPYHGPDNNPVSQDRLIRAPYMTQFLADPRYGPARQAAGARGHEQFGTPFLIHLGVSQIPVAWDGPGGESQFSGYRQIRPPLTWPAQIS